MSKGTWDEYQKTFPLNIAYKALRKREMEGERVRGREIEGEWGLEGERVRGRDKIINKALRMLYKSLVSY